jgi:hypothetical protein
VRVAIAMTSDSEAKHIKSGIPKQCHLWNDKELTRVTITKSLVLVKKYEDDSHLIRNLLRCRECGQLYFHEFYEIVDWTDGNDAQYTTWIPVEDVESADHLNALSPMELLRYGGMRVNYPSSAKLPTAPYWTMREPGQ